LSNIFDFCTKKKANSGANRVFRPDGIQDNLPPARMADILPGTDPASVRRCFHCRAPTTVLEPLHGRGVAGPCKLAEGLHQPRPAHPWRPHHRLTAIHPKRNIWPKWTIKSSKLEISPAGEIENNV
jgi:hypothetical protein